MQFRQTFFPNNMAFPFEKEIDDLEYFYRYTLNLYNKEQNILLPSSSSGAMVTIIKPQMIDRHSITSEDLRRATLALMCGLWEALIGDIKLNDIPRYTKKIQAPYHKWFDGNVYEIAQLRHCILHNNGVVDQTYLSKSVNPYGYALGDYIKLDTVIDIFFINIKKSFFSIMM